MTGPAHDLPLAELAAAVGDPARVSQGESIRALHGEDASALGPLPPDAVVLARSEDDVRAVLRACSSARVPVIPYGAGTSTDGHVLAPHGGVSLDLGEMDEIVELDAGNMTATVQPGVRRLALERAAGELGLSFPIDPGADASIGGMIATNASGTTTVRYGSMRHQVLALRVVLADGSVLRTGSRARKSSAGYDLTSLFVGSEGTLGVVTEATLRLHGIPEHTAVLRALFADVESACRVAARCMAAGLAVSRLELLDGACVAAINAYEGRDDPEVPCLLVESTGGREAVESEIAVIEQIAREEGGEGFETFADATALARLWRARHNSAHAIRAAAPGKHPHATDVCVPVAELPGAVAHARALLDREGVDAIVAGHAGDGNYHAVYMVDLDSPDEVRRAERIDAALVEHALSVGGTCSGEHGIGLGKKRFLEAEHGDLLPHLRAIKAAFDPLGILNPGKVFEAEPGGVVV
ncbi:MAG TPA: FAD-linked oxidase C-terminal domain-containing protein [Solirubrobacteraceae bacterium]|nr:FAD-linked oxidase C-terminal domain-containing protein [Solirubrobacteraceae bacterium]